MHGLGFTSVTGSRPAPECHTFELDRKTAAIGAERPFGAHTLEWRTQDRCEARPHWFFFVFFFVFLIAGPLGACAGHSPTTPPASVRATIKKCPTSLSENLVRIASLAEKNPGDAGQWRADPPGHPNSGNGSSSPRANIRMRRPMVTVPHQNGDLRQARTRFNDATPAAWW